ncbi:MAG TPA: helix-turn-helix domain-containing protein [Solirubrobacteraceae bacterium]
MRSEQAHFATRSSVQALLSYAENAPDKARFLMGETMAGGTSALNQRDKMVASIAKMIDDYIAKADVQHPTPDLPLIALIGGVMRLIAVRLRNSERHFQKLAIELSDWLDTYNQPIAERRWRSLEHGPPLPPSPHTADLRLAPPRSIQRGRVRLTPEEVEHNHRERIIFATAKAVSEKGYNATTVADIARAAGIDRRVFYMYFEDKEKAFMAVHELSAQQVMAVASSAFFDGRTWPDRLWKGIRAATHFDETYPTFCHTGYVEAHAVGGPAIQRINDTRMAFTMFLQEGYQHTTHPPSPSALEAITTCIFEIAYNQTRKGNATQLGRATALGTYLALSPFLGAQAANQFIDNKLREVS